MTRKGDKLYIHLLEAFGSTSFGLTIPELTGARLAGVKWLNVTGKLKCSLYRKTGYLTIVTDGSPLDPIDSIIEVTVK